MHADSWGSAHICSKAHAASAELSLPVLQQHCSAIFHLYKGACMLSHRVRRSCL